MAKQIALSKLVWDTEIYPRVDVSSVHVARIADAMRAGFSMPPIIVDKKSLRIVDGVNRWKAARQVLGDEGTIECELRGYASEKELFVEAVALNTGHGLQLTPFERTRCLLKMAELGISRDVALNAVRMTAERATKMEGAKTALDPRGNQIPIKGSMVDFRGQTLSKKAMDANKGAGGMRPLYYVEMLCSLLEAGLVSRADERLISGLERLSALLSEKLEKVSA